MLLSRRLWDRPIWKGAIARLYPRLGFTRATVVMPAKDLAVVILITNTHADASTSSSGPL